MADVSKLKRSGSKGSPPTPSETNNTLGSLPETITRGTDKAKSANVAITFSVPAEVADEFNRHALEHFGFRKGSKSDLFLAIWEKYAATNK